MSKYDSVGLMMIPGQSNVQYVYINMCNSSITPNPDRIIFAGGVQSGDPSPLWGVMYLGLSQGVCCQVSDGFIENNLLFSSICQLCLDKLFLSHKTNLLYLYTTLKIHCKDKKKKLPPDRFTSSSVKTLLLHSLGEVSSRRLMPVWIYQI